VETNQPQLYLDETALETLFKELYQQLCNYSFSIVNDMDEAEEITQQVFVNIWEQREKLAVTSYKSYLYRAVHNASLNKIKQAKVRKLYADDYAITAELHQSSNETKDELQKQITLAVQSLPEQCRMVFKLSRYEELKYAEIAEHLNISVKTVENHMGKALKILREKLKDYLPLLLLMFSFII
jgi:RNA polymerase sigma-70 factor (family 1)